MAGQVEYLVPHVSELLFMFDKVTRYDDEGRVVILGKSKRKGAAAILNIPISAELHQKLRERVVGSMSIGAAVLLEWALDELERRCISIEAQPNR